MWAPAKWHGGWGGGGGKWGFWKSIGLVGAATLAGGLLAAGSILGPVGAIMAATAAAAAAAIGLRK